MTVDFSDIGKDYRVLTISAFKGDEAMVGALIEPSGADLTFQPDGGFIYHPAVAFDLLANKRSSYQVSDPVLASDTDIVDVEILDANAIAISTPKAA